MPVRKIQFAADGETLIGDLHLPAGDGPFPGLIVGGPMTSVKEQVTGTYAAALADCGFAALAIDHRHYGQSGGEPRQYEFYEHKIEDLRAALDVLLDAPCVDSKRIAAVGVCLGCGYVAHALKDCPEVRGFAAIAGYYRDVPAMKAADPEGFARKVEEGRAARLHYEATGEVRSIPAVALDRDAAMTLQSTYDYYAGRAAHPNYTNAFAVMSREPFLQFDVQSAAPNITMPFLMAHGENALNPGWAKKFYGAVPAADKQFHEVPSKGQTDIYDDPAIVQPVSRTVRDFFLQVL